MKVGITTQKMKFSIKDFFSKCDQIHCFLLFRNPRKLTSSNSFLIFGTSSPWTQDLN